MQSQINEILKKIESLQGELKTEYEKLLEKYEYKIVHGKIVFLESIKTQNALLRENLFKYIFTANLKHLLSVPFIYGMLIPMLFLDFALWLYQSFAFPLYGIKKVRRADYFVYDRQFLDYLNLVQKVNCVYCTYGNGLFAYAVEIAARTERYWCPIKAAKHLNHQHPLYKEFADYGDAKGFIEIFNKNEDQ